MNIKNSLWIAILWTLAATTWGLAQQTEGQNPRSQQEQDNWVTKLYQISHQDVGQMSILLDGFIGRYQPSVSEHFNTLTLQAPDDVHAAVRALIEQYDQPLRTIIMQFHLLKGSRRADGVPPPLPEQIRSIVGEIASLTEFKSFELIASPQLRTVDGNKLGINGGQSFQYSIDVRNLRLLGEGRIQVQQLSVSLRDARQQAVSLHTSFEINDGETVVLGTSELEGGSGEALVTLVTAKLID